MPVAIIVLGLAAAAPETTPPGTLAKPQLICRQGEQIVGTHMRTGRRCKTAADWQLEDSKMEGPVPTLRLTGEQNDGHPLPQHPQ